LRGLGTTNGAALRQHRSIDPKIVPEIEFSPPVTRVVRNAG
jgi:hypothetical protein